MKKSLIALAVLAASGAAMAQSTVTVYGLVDASFGSFKTNVAGQTQTQTKIDTDGLNGNRWGLRISEDLGGGMSAIANLESGFNIDSGASAQGGLLFGRRANVGLSSSSYGTVTLGRNTSAYNDVAYDHSTLGASIFDPANLNNGTTAPTATAANLLGRRTTWLGFGERINNSVKYVSPNFSGVTFGALYGFGEDKLASKKASKTVSASVKYVNGPLLVSGGYQSEGVAVTGATVGKPALENVLVNAAYDFGVAKVAAGFNRAKYKDINVMGIVGQTDTAAQKEWNLSVAVPVGAATLSAGYAVSNGDDLGKSTGFGVQALYSLSKRTTLYAGALSTKAYDKAVAAQPVGSNIERTQTYAVGVRHTF